MCWLPFIVGKPISAELNLDVSIQTIYPLRLIFPVAQDDKYAAVGAGPLPNPPSMVRNTPAHKTTPRIRERSPGCLVQSGQWKTAIRAIPPKHSGGPAVHCARRHGDNSGVFPPVSRPGRRNDGDP